MRIALVSVMLLCLATVGVAQTVVADDGNTINVNSSYYNPTTLLPGSLTTTFAGGNGYCGNMFDITPTVDLEITSMDLNLDVPGETCTCDVYYKDGTCFGYEQDPSAWSIFVSGSAVAQGSGVASPMDLSGNGKIFLAGQTYGIFVFKNNYNGGQRMRYTNGSPTTYSNADLTLLSNCGSSQYIWSTPFYDRIWNGTIYYETQSGPQLVVSDLYAGQTGTFTFTGGTPNTNAYLAYSVTGPGSVYVPFLDVTLDIAKPKQAGSTVVSDPSGTTIWNLPIPNNPGLTVYLQALQYQVKTNVVQTIVL